jgi:xylose isomerase
MWKLAAITWAFESVGYAMGPLKVLRPGLSTEEAISKIGEIGLQGAELAIWDIDIFVEKRVQSVREALEKTGLTLCNICFNDGVHVYQGQAYTSPDETVRKDLLRRFEKTVDVASELGCSSIAVWPGADVYPLKQPYWGAWESFITTISACTDLARANDCVLSLEYKPGCILPNADSVLRAVKEIDGSGLGGLLDTGHAIVAGEDLPTVVEMFGDRLFHVHVDDNPGDWDRDMPPGSVHDFKPFLRSLKMVGYRGFLSMDIWPMTDPYTEVKSGKEYLEEAISKI